MSVTRRTVLGAAFAAPWMEQAAARGEPRWIDVHLHAIGGANRQFGQAIDRAIAEMNVRGISKAVVFPPPFPSRAFAFDYSAYVPELKRYPGRFGFLGGGGLLNPMLSEFSDPSLVTESIITEFVRRANRILDAGAAGFGEIAILHLSLVPNHPFEEVTIAHPLLYKLVEIAGSRKSAIDLHMDPVVRDAMPLPSTLKSPPNLKTLMKNIAGFDQLLRHHRDARIVWAHGGSDFTGNMTPALVGRLMDVHPNLFMSLRPIPPMLAVANPFNVRAYNLILTASGVDPAWLALLQKHADRFVMGADAFFLSESVIAESPLRALARGNQNRLLAASKLLSLLDPELSRKIGFENAQRIYSL